MLRITIEEDGEWGPKPDTWNDQYPDRPWPPFTRQSFKIEKAGFKWRVTGDVDSVMLKVMNAIDKAMARNVIRGG